MRRWAPILLLSSALGGAPFQCAGDPDPNRAREERPGQALYELAKEFKKSGDESAWRETLEYLIENYPASRFAETAKHDLEAAGPSGGKPATDTSRTAASPK